MMKNALKWCLLFATTITVTNAVRVAFIADTGIGNDNPSDYWTNFRGEVQEPKYFVNNKLCYDHAGKPCQLYSRARDVVRMAKDSGADIIVHVGDLDYESAPKQWINFLDETMRGKVEYLAAKGNHDADGWDGVPYLWSGSEGYEKLLKNYGVPKGAKCKGQYGVDMSCEYKGVLFVISSVGVERSGESSNQDHYYHLENSLKNSNAQWKICVWHMTMEKAQVSYKGDATGWGAYEICRKYGAFIVTGHSHVYSRTREMSRFGTKQYGFTKEDLKWWDAPDDDKIYLSDGINGTTAVAVVGIGGYKNEECLKGGSYWSKIYSSKCGSCANCVTARDANEFGTLICDFPEFGPGAKATCWLATVPRRGASDEVWQAAVRTRNPVDSFFLINGKRPKEKDVSSSAGNDGDNISVRSLTDCYDREVPGDAYSCFDRSTWKQCNENWLVNGNYCKKTCNRCDERREQPVEEEEEEPIARTRNEELALNQAFAQFDLNQDGFIDFIEWERLYTLTRPGSKTDVVDNEKLQKQFFDVAVDGKISRSAFPVLLNPSASP